ncbi:MAG: hypothetical protein QOI13_623, partial [Paraburkholderia sp.]|nr:hypothetical protein [Paraburkholderia sp.]
MPVGHPASWAQGDDARWRRGHVKRTDGTDSTDASRPNAAGHIGHVGNKLMAEKSVNGCKSAAKTVDKHSR